MRARGNISLFEWSVDGNVTVNESARQHLVYKLRVISGRKCDSQWECMATFSLRVIGGQKCDSHIRSSAEHIIKIGVPRWKVTQSYAKVVPGSLNSSNLKMSTTDYQQPSDLNEFYRDEERYIIPPGPSAEQPVRISINSYLRKIWRLATLTVGTQGSRWNFAIATHSTTNCQRMSNSLELV